MNEQTSHKWSPITDLPEDWASLADQQVASVMRAWLDKAERLRESKAYGEFLAKLRRKWAIETGVLERLYSISEGATRTLVEKGFDASLLSHDDTDKPLSQVLDLIQDQYAALEGLMQFISGQRRLGKSYIRELHQVLTAHQQNFDARDSLGNYVQRPMIRGEWKTQPNNVEGPNGFYFEFCPPEQVESELDRMLILHRDHISKDVPPEVQAAWLHHRFALIHPFVDGNGRVARCLATLVFLKYNWFPLVIARDDKPAYISSLRQADRGDLAGVVKLFGELTRKAAREAFSVSEEVEREAQAIKSILSSVEQKLAKRKAEQLQEYDRAVRTSEALFFQLETRLRDLESQVSTILAGQDQDHFCSLAAASCGSEKAGWYRFQIGQAAKQLGYFANLSVYPAWVALNINAGVHTAILFSFHGIGHDWSGVLVCSALAFRKQPSDEADKKESVDIKPLAREPFEITYDEDPVSIPHRFMSWAEDCIVSGLAYWQEEI